MSIKIFKNYTSFTIVILVVFLACVKSVSAALEITEVMYDPVGSNTNHQWVEVYNNSADSFEVDALKWRINDGSSHYLNDKVNFIVPGNSYFILTGDKDTFLSDHTGFGGMVIDTVLSLDKDGDTVSIINDGSNVDSVTYTSSMGAAEDGNSLQKIGSTFKSGQPTPGADNQESAPVVDDTNNNTDISSNTSGNTQTTSGSASSSNPSSSSSSSGGSNSTKMVNTKPVNPKITTNIISKKIVVTGVAFDMKSETIGPGKELLTSGRWLWNFGDGESKQENTPSKFTHTYFYPGEYVVTLEYYETLFDTEPKVTDRLVIKALDTTVIVSSVGDYKDPYVELKNESNNEIDISNWNLNGKNRTFKIPKGTNLLGNHSLKISSRVTLFDINDLKAIQLTSPTNELIAIYPDYSQKEKKTNEDSEEKVLKDTSVKYEKASDVSSDTKETMSEVFPEVVKDIKVVDLNNLSASALNAQPLNKKNDVNNKDIAYAGLGTLLAGALGTLFINKKKINFSSQKNNSKSETNDDFKILE